MRKMILAVWLVAALVLGGCGVITKFAIPSEPQYDTFTVRSVQHNELGAGLFIADDQWYIFQKNIKKLYDWAKQLEEELLKQNGEGKK